MSSPGPGNKRREQGNIVSLPRGRGMHETKPRFLPTTESPGLQAIASDLDFGRAAMGRIDSVIGVVGALLLAHGAVSTVLYRGALKIREEDFTYPPPQVLIEVALSLVLCLWAALKVPGAFLPILPDAKENRVTKLPANSDFMIFNHRGKIFLPELVEAKFS